MARVAPAEAAGAVAGVRAGDESAAEGRGALLFGAVGVVAGPPPEAVVVPEGDAVAARDDVLGPAEREAVGEVEHPGLDGGAAVVGGGGGHGGDEVGKGLGEGGYVSGGDKEGWG